MTEFDIKIKETTQLQKFNFDTEEQLSLSKQKIAQLEKEKEEIILRAKHQIANETNELKDKVLKEKNASLENVTHKIKLYERDIKDLVARNHKLEEACAKYQEVNSTL
jgi:uncharacterized glyoxalase superfamily protein PhnB